ncbi:hypothetical protein [Brevibacillus brevis]|uniref:hypothetical protein n=1 Tax=Brevibacillus brevis TaxID=1393 RepID=UPI0037C672CD
MTGNNEGYRFYITPDEYALAAANGIHAEAVNIRVRLWAWKVEHAITIPIRKQKDRRQWAKVAKENGVCYQTFMNRVLSLGWDEEKAATTPILDRYEVIKEIADKKGRIIPREYLELAKKNGLQNIVHKRVKRGWDFKTAATLPPMDKVTSGKIGAERSKNSSKQAEIQAWKKWLFPRRAKTV